MDYIDKIIYINLEKRTDRNQEILEELQQFDIPKDKIERFNAIEDEYGFIGCTKSHLQILKLAKERNYENILIFEDDFHFIIHKKSFHNKLNTFFKNYHKIFDVVMLAYNLSESEPKDDLVGYARKAQAPSAYIINRRILDELIIVMEEGLQKLINTHHHWLYMNDTSWFELQKTKEWYYFIERMGKQRPGYSNLTNQYMDYGI
jgi:glycosyl transferase, family 25